MHVSASTLLQSQSGTHYPHSGDAHLHGRDHFLLQQASPYGGESPLTSWTQESSHLPCSLRPSEATSIAHLIDAAGAMLNEARLRVLDDNKTFCSPSKSDSPVLPLPDWAQEDPALEDSGHHHSPPELLALRFSLTAAGRLLRISQLLLEAPGADLRQERDRCDKLVEDAKAAGRAAYRAALFVCEKKGA